MNFNDIVEKRQSIRRYKEGDIPEADLKEMIRVAGLAPSGKNIQNWHFVVIKDLKTKQDIADIIKKKNLELCAEVEKVAEGKGDKFAKFASKLTYFWRDTAPVLIVILTKEYLPSSYAEYELIGAETELLNSLKHKKNPGMQSLGAAVENLTLKAVEMGYGTCWQLQTLGGLY